MVIWVFIQDTIVSSTIQNKISIVRHASDININCISKTHHIYQMCAQIHVYSTMNQKHCKMIPGDPSSYSCFLLDSKKAGRKHFLCQKKIEISQWHKPLQYWRLVKSQFVRLKGLKPNICLLLTFCKFDKFSVTKWLSYSHSARDTT